MKIHRDGDAEAAFRSAIEFSAGQYAPAHFGLGLVLCDRKNFVEARATIQTGLELDSESWSGYYAMGRALLGLNQLEDAEESARNAIARKPDLRESYLLLADIHAQEKKQSAILEDLDNYIALDPDSVTRRRAQNARDEIQRTLSLQSNAATSQP